MQILREFVEKRSSISPPELDYSSLAQMAEGYTPADMRDLVDNAVQQMIVRVMGGGGAVRTCPPLWLDTRLIPGDSARLVVSGLREGGSRVQAEVAAGREVADIASSVDGYRRYAHICLRQKLGAE